LATILINLTFILIKTISILILICTSSSYLHTDSLMQHALHASPPPHLLDSHIQGGVLPLNFAAHKALWDDILLRLQDVRLL